MVNAARPVDGGGRGMSKQISAAFAGSANGLSYLSVKCGACIALPKLTFRPTENHVARIISALGGFDTDNLGLHTPRDFTDAPSRRVTHDYTDRKQASAVQNIFPVPDKPSMVE